MTKTIERPGMLLPEIDDVTRREFLIGASGLLLLPAGCGNGEEAGNEASGETRIVEHALGTTDVPMIPQRVVTLWEPALSALVAVGMEPIATVGDAAAEDYGLGTSAPPGFDFEDLEIVGAQGEPDLERIVALEPDMIVGISVLDEPVYEELSQIAPTVSFDWGSGTGDWKGYFDRVVTAVGKEDEGQRFVEEYERRAAELGEALGGRLESTEVSIVRVRPEAIRLEPNNSFAGIVAEDVGLPRPPAQDVAPEDQAIEISLELLPDADGDVMFLMSIEDSQDRMERLRSSPLWQQLDVVKQDAVYTVDYGYWQGSNYYAANVVR